MYHNGHQIRVCANLHTVRYWCSCSGSALVQSIYLSCLLLEGHEVQICDIHHVRPAHHRQHPVLNLARHRADIQEFSQFGLL